MTKQDIIDTLAEAYELQHDLANAQPGSPEAQALQQKTAGLILAANEGLQALL